eukprot:TRINITY_DN5744_c1_g1_i3.p1 TRINITY_DN5744_c1_g1~~TRINITY_DN5744_c1_g1_i3.p1  ORF type:complete len:134 (+),score=15.52 TRINITY_DN5744_c1_g1_i3:64-465(+)
MYSRSHMLLISQILLLCGFPFMALCKFIPATKLHSRLKDNMIFFYMLFANLISASFVLMFIIQGYEDVPGIGQSILEAGGATSTETRYGINSSVSLILTSLVVSAAHLAILSNRFFQARDYHLIVPIDSPSSP